MKIYDAKYIITGIVIFLAVFTSPVWFNVVEGATGDSPDLAINTSETQCVEQTHWMEDNHMELLRSWREQVVRSGIQTYTASDGKQYQMSLDTCIECHQDTSNFCDQCHNYVSDIPDCWDCHNLPEVENAGN